MDLPDADPEQLRRSLAFIRKINAALGYKRATLKHLERFSRRWAAGQTITILDVATGSGDIPMAILQWADRRKLKVRIVGIDLHAETARTAAAAMGNEQRFSVVRGDAAQLPFDDAAFDYVMTSMFLHHLDDEMAIAVLQEISRVARRGVIVSDLLRNHRAYAWITLFTLFAGPMVKHDARVSVAQAFKYNEILDLRNRAEMEFATYFHHFGHRFILAGEKDH